VEHGTANFMGHDVEVEIYDKQPDKRVVITRLPDGESTTVFDGQLGWSVAPHRPVMQVPSAEIPSLQWDADLQFPLHVRETMGELHPAAPEKIGDRDTYQLLGGTPEQPKARLYFDQQSGLLVRMIRYSASPLGFNPTRIDYADYRAVDGVQVPYRWTTARPAGQMTIQIRDAQQNVPVDDAKFAKPSNPEAKSQ
jgi:outer membrane lipoprotein-sorting protein